MAFGLVAMPKNAPLRFGIEGGTACLPPNPKPLRR